MFEVLSWASRNYSGISRSHGACNCFDYSRDTYMLVASLGVYFEVDEPSTWWQLRETANSSRTPCSTFSADMVAKFSFALWKQRSGSSVSSLTSYSDTRKRKNNGEKGKRKGTVRSVWNRQSAQNRFNADCLHALQRRGCCGALRRWLLSWTYHNKLFGTGNPAELFWSKSSVLQFEKQDRTSDQDTTALFTKAELR